MRGTSRRALLSTLILASTSHAARAEPVAVRDQNPLLRGQYLPVAASSGRPDGRLAHHVLLTLSNTTNLETRGGESLRIDGEALELRWLATWQPARRLQMRFTLPVVHYSGGALDGAIDEWHDLLGLPRGQRPQGARGELDYRYSSAAGTVQETQDHTAVGDGAVEAGYLLAATDRAFVSSRLPRICAPTPRPTLRFTWACDSEAHHER